MDRDIYSKTMQEVLRGKNQFINNSEIVKQLQIVEENVSSLVVEDGKCKGIKLKNGGEIRADCVVLTTGTFLGGKVHIGTESRPAGRFIRVDKA